MGYVVQGIDYSGMAANAYLARHWLTALGLAFCGLALVQVVWMWRKKGRASLKNSAANFGVFTFSKVISLTGAGSMGAGVVWACWEARLWTLPNAWWSWALCFLAQDYAFYWWHRLRHESALWWASHESHHSSEVLNLSTAFRITDTMNLLGAFLFMCPFALAGMHPAALAVCAFSGRVWQIWMHANGAVPPGWWDRWLVTDAVHRLHHAKNLEYLDKNYGAVISIWDRLHGTFADPNRPGPEPVFGVLGGAAGSNPIKIALRGFVILGTSVARERGMVAKFKALFAGPGWSSEHGSEGTVRGMRAAWAAGRLELDEHGVPILKERAARGVTEAVALKA